MRRKMIKKLLCVVLSGSMIFGNAGITMASETEPKTVQENVNEETDSPEESFLRKIFLKMESQQTMKQQNYLIAQNRN